MCISIKLKSMFGRKPMIDNYVFTLHYRITFILLLSFAFYVAFYQYFGRPIDCFSDYNEYPKGLNDLCWMHSTYSILQLWDKKVGEEVPFPGADKYTPGDEKRYYDYYRFVSIALLLQAITFYLPRYFWKRMEGGVINDLTMGLNSLTLKEGEKQIKKRKIVEYLAVPNRYHNLYFAFYVLAEIWNFCNTVGQLVFINDFVGGDLLSATYNIWDISGWSRMERKDSMVKIFPRVTKCIHHKYGLHGYIERHQATCILPINVINEKIYIFLAIWFVILAVLSGLALVWRTITMMCPKCRLIVIYMHARSINMPNVRAIIQNCDVGDWMILSLLSKNLDSLSFRYVVNEFASRLADKKDHTHSHNSFLSTEGHMFEAPV